MILEYISWFGLNLLFGFLFLSCCKSFDNICSNVGDSQESQVVRINRMSTADWAECQSSPDRRDSLMKLMIVMMDPGGEWQKKRTYVRQNINSRWWILTNNLMLTHTSNSSSLLSTILSRRRGKARKTQNLKIYILVSLYPYNSLVSIIGE